MSLQVHKKNLKKSSSYYYINQILQIGVTGINEASYYASADNESFVTE